MLHLREIYISKIWILHCSAFPPLIRVVEMSFEGRKEGRKDHHHCHHHCRHIQHHKTGVGILKPSEIKVVINEHLQSRNHFLWPCFTDNSGRLRLEAAPPSGLGNCKPQTPQPPQTEIMPDLQKISDLNKDWTYLGDNLQCYLLNTTHSGLLKSFHTAVHWIRLGKGAEKHP